MRLLIPNLAFEDELRGRHLKAAGRANQAIRDLAPVFGLLANPEDAVLLAEVPRDDEVPPLLRHVRFVSDLPTDASEWIPFGWSPLVQQMATISAADHLRPPDPRSVHHVNSRQFNATHDYVVSVHGEQYPFRSTFGRLCRSLDEWRNGVTELSGTMGDNWIAKPAISNAGRNRLTGCGPGINSQQEGWLKKRISEDGYVYLEPWVQRTVEFGLQFEIYADGAVKYVGAAQLINDAAGRYQGSVIGSTSQVAPDQAVEHGWNVCHAAYQAGYFGPLGIDCFQFTIPEDASNDPGQDRTMVRLCNDINARYTMGRIALQLQNQLSDSEFAFWGQFKADDFLCRLPSERICSDQMLMNDVRVKVTNPRTIQGRPVRTVTALLIATSESMLHHVRRYLMAEN